MVHPMGLASMAALLLSVVGAPPASPSVVRLEDPANDDKGPGTYTYPTNPSIRPGQFDLRRFELSIRGDVARFEIWLGAPLEPPGGHESNPALRDYQNRIYLQNIDIYIDRDPGAGSVESVPGRNVRFPDAEAWDLVIVLTPDPYRVRSLLSDWSEHERALVPSNVRSESRRVYVDVPLSDLGGLPSPTWGYQVLITGARSDESFDVVRRLTGDHLADALTLKVSTVAEPDTFGGGTFGLYQPRVIDALSPIGRDQRAFLSGWEEDGRRLAVVPMVVPDLAGRAKEQEARAKARAEARREADRLPLPALSAVEPPKTATVSSPWALSQIRSVEGELVVLELPSRAAKRLSIGAVLDPAGRVIARVVLTAEYPQFLLATVVEGASALVPGATVRFEPVKE